MLEAFGRTDFAYSFEEKYDFLLSLTRGERESLNAYLSRLEWVMRNPLALKNDDTSWIKMMFLMGLQEDDQVYFFDKICADELKNLCDVVKETLDDKAYISSALKPKEEELNELWVKEEYEQDDFEELPLPDYLEVEYKLGDDIEGKRKKRKYERSGKFVGIKKRANSDIPADEPKEKKPRPPRKYQKLRGCITCGLDKTMTPDEWDEHETKFHLGKCDLCAISFDNLEGMRRHHDERHQGKSAMCSNCNLPQKRYLLNHVPCKFEGQEQKKDVKQEVAAGEQSVLENATPPKKLTGAKFVRTTDRHTQKTREGIHIHLLKDGENPDSFRTFTSHLLKVESNGKLFRNLCIW